MMDFLSQERTVIDAVTHHLLWKLFSQKSYRCSIGSSGNSSSLSLRLLGRHALRGGLTMSLNRNVP